MMKVGNVCIMSPIVTVLAIALLIGGCSFLQQQVKMVESHLGNEGPAFQEGMTPSTIGWGPDDQAYPDRFVVYPDDGSELVWVPPGSFPMGSPEGEGSACERPQRNVEITSGFWIGKHEVTNAQYRSLCEVTGQEFPDKSDQGDYHPVTYVSWHDAVAYAEHQAMELPTEAQWEYAARGPEGRIYPWGNGWDGSRCWRRNQGPDGRTFSVGSFPEGASWVGALDMAGNAEEWCVDWYDPDYYERAPDVDPPGPSEAWRTPVRGGFFSYGPVIRGGSWYGMRLRADDPAAVSDDDEAAALRTADRSTHPKAKATSPIGFRIVKSVDTRSAADQAGEARAIPEDITLHDAANRGNVDAVKAFLDAGADINEQDENEITPLHMAVFRDQAEAVALLLDRGADPEIRDKDGRTALHWCGFLDHTESASVLLDHGADINAAIDSADGFTPVHMAAVQGHTEVLSLLLERGAEVDAVDSKGRTPLHLAAKDGHAETAALLIDRGADIEAFDEDDWTPLIFATSNDHVEVAALLIDRGADVNTRGQHGGTSLHVAAVLDAAAVMELLLEHGARVDMHTELEGKTPLSLAARQGNAASTALLLARGADVNARDDRGQTPLHGAATGGHTRVIEMLLARDAEVDARDERISATPLHLAARHGRSDAVLLLLRRGADANAKSDKVGLTPLHLAAGEGHIDTVVGLLDGGADPNAEGTGDLEGATALILAAARGHTELVELLVERGAEL